MCIVFIVTISIEIIIDSIPLPTAQKKLKQIPNMICERPIQGTYADPTLPSW